MGYLTQAVFKVIEHWASLWWIHFWIWQSTVQRQPYFKKENAEKLWGGGAVRGENSLPGRHTMICKMTEMLLVTSSSLACTPDDRKSWRKDFPLANGIFKVLVPNTINPCPAELWLLSRISWALCAPIILLGQLRAEVLVGVGVGVCVFKL